MAGHMRGRMPAEPGTSVAEVIQEIRMRAGISRKRCGLNRAVEKGERSRDWEWLLDGSTWSGEVLLHLGIEPSELMEFTLGTLGREALAARAMERLLHRERRCSEEDELWRQQAATQRGRRPDGASDESAQRDPGERQLSILPG